jgi:cell volume regulation protein A
MDLSNYIILLGGALLLLSVFSSVLSARSGVPLLLVFLILGMAAGEDGIGGIQYDDVQSAHLLGSLALAVILFDGGLRTNMQTFRVGLAPALVLATLGVIMTVAITGAVATWALGLHWMEGMLVGAIIGSTDAAAVFGLLHARGLELKQRVGATLEIESGSNDPMAVFLTIVLVEALSAGRTSLDWFVLGDFAMQMGLGALIGLAGGRLFGHIVNRLRLAPGLYPLLVLAGALTIFGLTASLGGSGFLAVYLAGLLIGNRPLQSGANIHRFHDGMAWLAQISMFLMLGLLVTPSNLLYQAVPAMLVAAVLILVARPAAVFLCLAPFRFPWREQLFIAWVGLRGAVPIILALFPLLAGLDNGATYFNVAFFVVLVSLIVQGWTVAPAARWLRLNLPPSPGAIQRVELDLPGQKELELVAYRVETGSPIIARSIQEIPLPPGCQIAGVIRNEKALVNCTAELFQQGDYVYLLAFRRDLSPLDQLFAGMPPYDADERRFFGEFLLHGSARLHDVAAVYGFSVPEDVGELTLAQYLADHFHGRQVIGDRIRLGEVELVIQEIQQGETVKVGLKLPQPLL